MSAAGAWMLIYLMASGETGRFHFDSEEHCMAAQQMLPTVAMERGKRVRSAICIFKEEPGESA